jgi:Tfp pilus assembly protein PilO
MSTAKGKKSFSSDLNLKSLFINRRYLIYTIATALLAIVVVFSGIIPQIESISNLNKDLNKEQESLLKLRQKTADLENIKSQELFSYVDEVDKVLPSTKPLLELLSALNVVASNNGVIFTNLSLSPGEIASESAEFLSQAKSSSKRKQQVSKAAATGFDTIDVELQVSGQFSQVQQFFTDIERVAPLITITSLSLGVQSDDIIKSTDLVQADLIVSVYHFTQQVSSALESALPKIDSKERKIIEEISQYYYAQVEAQNQIMGGGLDDLFGLDLQNY